MNVLINVPWSGGCVPGPIFFIPPAPQSLNSDASHASMQSGMDILIYMEYL